MRIVVFFDLPTITSSDRREYTRFRKFLIKNGFVMVQESVYTRMVLNASVKDSVVNLLQKNKPPAGMVQALLVTEKQFSGMINICGEFTSDVIDSDDRVIIL